MLFVAVELVVVAEAAASGGSGVGTDGVDAALRLAGAGVEPVLLVAEGFVVASATSEVGASGAGIGVPPAASAPTGQASAKTQAPAASTSCLNRRDDVRLDIPSLPFGPSRYVGGYVGVNRQRWSGPPGYPRPRHQGNSSWYSC